MTNSFRRNDECIQIAPGSDTKTNSSQKTELKYQNNFPRCNSQYDRYDRYLNMTKKISVLYMNYIVPTQYTKKAPIYRQGGISKGKK